MSLVRSSLLVGLGSIASRVLGFVRDILFAQALGAGPVADAFLAAFRLPNLVRRVVGEGGLNPVLVPALARLESHEAAALCSRTMGVFALALLALTGFVEIGAGLIALVLAPGLQDDGTLALVALYTRLAFPMVLGITLASIGAALLNLRGRFGAATLAPLAVNGGLILTALLLDAASALPLERKAAWLAAASTLSGLVQLGIVGTALKSCGAITLRIGRPIWSPAMRNLLLAGFPALVASGAVQLFVLAGTQVASFWPSGVSWLYYADRVVQLPLSLIAALGASVLLPQLALLHRAGQAQELVGAQNKALETALLLALPASAALFVLAGPMAAVLFERGAFQAPDTQGTALSLMGLSLGLPFATMGKILSQTLFARGSLRATLFAALIGIVVTLLASPLLGWPFGPIGIAFGISLGCVGHAGVTVWLLRRFGLWSPDRPFLNRLGRIAGATIVMSLGLLFAKSLVPHPGSMALAGFCSGGLALYGLAAWLLGAVTRDDLAKLAKMS